MQTKTFGMFTPAGDEMVAAMVDAAKEQADRGAFLREQMDMIEHDHPEVFDTDVREQIIAALGDYTLTIFDLV